MLAAFFTKLISWYVIYHIETQKERGKKKSDRRGGRKHTAVKKSETAVVAARNAVANGKGIASESGSEDGESSDLHLCGGGFVFVGIGVGVDNSRG